MRPYAVGSHHRHLPGPQAAVRGLCAVWGDKRQKVFNGVYEMPVQRFSEGSGGSVKVHEALSKVMADVGAVKKSGHNSQSNYNFRGIDAVTSAVYPALVKHGVVVAPKVLDYQYGTVVVGRNRTEMGHARLTVEFTFHGPEGDQLVAVTAGEAFDSGDKATAKAHSVALRTALLQTLCLPTDEPDPDSHTYERSEADPAAEDFAAAREELAAKAKQLGFTRQGIEDRCLAEMGEPVTAEKIREFIKALDEAVQEPAGATA